MRGLLSAATLLAVSAWSFAAWATPTRVASIQRQSAAESARARALKARAEEAARSAAKLHAGLAETEAQAREAQAAAARAQAEAAALARQGSADAADQARDQQFLTLTFAALLQSEAASGQVPAPAPEDVRAGLLAALTAQPLIQAVSDRQARIEATERLRAEKDQQRADLERTGAQLASMRQAVAAQLAETARRHLALLAESSRAARHAEELGRKAHSLSELTDKIGARGAPSARILAPAPSGPRTAPAAGRVLIAYGAKTPAGPARGMTLAVKPGARIVAPAAATIAYAGPFRSYGQVVILDQGAGSAIVLTGLQSVQALVGKKVASGEVIGEMPSAPAPSAPELYFEVRQAGRTVNPERWLGAGR